MCKKYQKVKSFFCRLGFSKWIHWGLTYLSYLLAKKHLWEWDPKCISSSSKVSSMTLQARAWILEEELRNIDEYYGYFWIWFNLKQFPVRARLAVRSISFWKIFRLSSTSPRTQTQTAQFWRSTSRQLWSLNGYRMVTEWLRNGYRVVTEWLQISSLESMSTRQMAARRKWSVLPRPLMEIWSAPCWIIGCPFGLLCVLQRR